VLKNLDGGAKRLAVASSEVMNGVVPKDAMSMKYPSVPIAEMARLRKAEDLSFEVVLAVENRVSAGVVHRVAVRVLARKKTIDNPEVNAGCLDQHPHTCATE